MRIALALALAACGARQRPDEVWCYAGTHTVRVDGEETVTPEVLHRIVSPARGTITEVWFREDLGTAYTVTLTVDGAAFVASSPDPDADGDRGTLDGAPWAWDAWTWQRTFAGIDGTWPMRYERTAAGLRGELALDGGSIVVAMDSAACAELRSMRSPRRGSSRRATARLP